MGRIFRGFGRDRADLKYLDMQKGRPYDSVLLYQNMYFRLQEVLSGAAPFLPIE